MPCSDLDRRRPIVRADEGGLGDLVAAQARLAETLADHVFERRERVVVHSAGVNRPKLDVGFGNRLAHGQRVRSDDNLDPVGQPAQESQHQDSGKAGQDDDGDPSLHVASFPPVCCLRIRLHPRNTCACAQVQAKKGRSLRCAQLSTPQGTQYVASDFGPAFKRELVYQDFRESQ